MWVYISAGSVLHPELSPTLQLSYTAGKGVHLFWCLVVPGMAGGGAVKRGVQRNSMSWGLLSEMQW